MHKKTPINIDNLQAYQKHIADTYNERSWAHDSSEWHQKKSFKLVEVLPPHAGDSVLDIGTGTGTLAFRAATLVGSEGRVIGVDLSRAMLARANDKLSVLGLPNLEFIFSDAEHLEFPDSSFDRIYCSSAFFSLLNPLATLGHWFNLLKPGGGLAFYALPEISYFWLSIAQDVLTRYDLPYLLNTPAGTIEKTRCLLRESGFKEIVIREEKSGYYVPLAKAKESWITVGDFAPGQYPYPVNDVAPDIMTRCQQEYIVRIEELNTDKGVWNDVTMYYIYAYK